MLEQLLPETAKGMNELIPRFREESKGGRDGSRRRWLGSTSTVDNFPIPPLGPIRRKGSPSLSLHLALLRAGSPKTQDDFGCVSIEMYFFSVFFLSFLSPGAIALIRGYREWKLNFHIWDFKPLPLFLRFKISLSSFLRYGFCWGSFPEIRRRKRVQRHTRAFFNLTTCYKWKEITPPSSPCPQSPKKEQAHHLRSSLSLSLSTSAVCKMESLQPELTGVGRQPSSCCS